MRLLAPNEWPDAGAVLGTATRPFWMMQYAFWGLNKMPIPLGGVLDGALAPGGEGGI